MEQLLRSAALAVLVVSAAVALLQLAASGSGQLTATRAKNKYGIELPEKYARVEDAIAAAEPFAMGGHRGTMFYLANGRRQYSPIKYTEAADLLARERCNCFLNTGKGVANTLYVPDPCEQYTRLHDRCRQQQKPVLVITTEGGVLKLGIHCTRLDGLLVNCPIR